MKPNRKREKEKLVKVGGFRMTPQRLPPSPQALNEAK